MAVGQRYILIHVHINSRSNNKQRMYTRGCQDTDFFRHGPSHRIHPIAQEPSEV
jgi:hypothetical protein